MTKNLIAIGLSSSVLENWQSFVEVPEYPTYKPETRTKKQEEFMERAVITAPEGALTGVPELMYVVGAGGEKKQVGIKDIVEFMQELTSMIEGQHALLCGVNIRQICHQIAIAAAAAGHKPPAWLTLMTGSRSLGFVDPVAIFGASVPALLARLGIDDVKADTDENFVVAIHRICSKILCGA